MDEQPVALRLADALEEKEYPPRRAAAAELRRLHQSEREGWRYANELEQERKRLTALNAQLLDKVLQVIKEMRPAAAAIKDKPASWWLDRIEEAVKQLKEKNNG